VRLGVRRRFTPRSTSRRKGSELEPAHPPIEALLALTGESPAPGEPAAEPKWMEHLKTCHACAELYRELKAWRDAVRHGDVGDAPEAWIRKAEKRATPRSFWEPLLGAFRADVVFDSGMALAPGTRADALQGRQWVLAIDRLEMELSVAPAGAGEAPPLTGQLLQVEGAPVKLGGCRVVLMEGETERGETRTLDTGEFLFRDRPSGAFQVRVDGDGWSIQTPLLEP
jgi:hypothetical protein